ncbi:MAG: LysM peptidoglycan-binding domain-containing protein [Actinobacteria bacterium]|nr:MAG: LysM peptidoglycan-binding domain-containing protein [Actinomycetota bacterium]
MRRLGPRVPSLTTMSGLPLVQPGVLEAVTQHVNSAWARKVGGILVGRAVVDRTRVEGALPARQTEEYADEIAFPAQVWEEAYAALGRFPGARIVGWYHSHPGTGVNLSEYDRRMHTTLFGEPINVALVMDPVSQRMAWFGWMIGRLSPLDPGEASDMVAVAPSPPRGVVRASVAALVALGLGAAATGGYWIGRESHPSTPVTVQALQHRLDAQSVRAARLREQLREAGQRLAASGTELRQATADLAAVRTQLADARSALAKARRAAPAAVRYRVQTGDTLWSLAAAFFGDPSRWPEIARTNRDQIPNPDRLLAGQVIEIPLRPAR